MPLVLNPSKDGFEKVLRDYQIETLRMVWENPDKGATSREVFVSVNKALEGIRTISRASIINFLNSMCDEGVLNYEEETCKGGCDGGTSQPWMRWVSRGTSRGRCSIAF